MSSLLLMNGCKSLTGKFMPTFTNSLRSKSLYYFSVNASEGKQTRLLSFKDPQGVGMKERIRLLYSKYGKIGIATYFTISTSSLLTIYALLKNGVDLTAISERLGIDRENFRSGGTLLVALGLNKILFPARIGLSFYLTPKIARFVGRT